MLGISAMLYRVCWRSKLTGATGCDEPTAERAVLEAYLAVEMGNPDFEFWIETVTDASPGSRPG
jgi:hypothetical protein